MTAVIRTENLTVRYGASEAISSLDLTVPEGTVGLLGPNGAGKSTLLKTLLGFVSPSRGSAQVLGHSVAGSPTRLRERIGYFPERSAFIPGLTAVELVALAGELGGLSANAALSRAHEVLWFTGLGEARYRLVEDFSAGMKQRTKLAVALVHDPELVLLDEPTSGLDPGGRRQMLQLVREVSAQGVSVLLSTHLLHDVEEVCDSVALLNRGRLALEGALRSLKQHPGWVYEIRVKESEPGAFLAALKQRQLDIVENKDGLLRIHLEEPLTRFFFEAARAASAEIRHLRRFERSLEEQFLGAVGTDSDKAL